MLIRLMNELRLLCAFPIGSPSSLDNCDHRLLTSQGCTESGYPVKFIGNGVYILCRKRCFIYESGAQNFILSRAHSTRVADGAHQTPPSLHRFNRMSLRGTEACVLA